MSSKAYKKNIAEGKGILVFFALIAVVIRSLYFFFLDHIDPPSPFASYLWQPIASLFEDRLYSYIASTLSIALIAALLAYINNKHTLIRQRTYLPSAFGILFFGCYPPFILMTADLLSTITLLYIIHLFFQSYNEPRKQNGAFNTSFFLALGSLFSLSLLIFVPVLWIGLAIMRNFSFKALLASLASFILVYLPVLSYFLLTNNPDGFIHPFQAVDPNTLLNFPVLKFEISDWVVLGFSAVVVVIALIGCYYNRYRDKIRVRAYLTLLGVLVTYAFLCFSLLQFASQTALYVILAITPLLLSHFFALTGSKWVTYLFYITAICGITFAFSPFFH